MTTKAKRLKLARNDSKRGFNRNWVPISAKLNKHWKGGMIQQMARAHG